MNCSELEAFLDLVPLGTLDTADAELVETHVATCAPCAEKTGALRAAYATLDTLVASEAKPLHGSLREKLMAAAEAPASLPETMICQACSESLAARERVFAASERAWFHAECFVKMRGAPEALVGKPAEPVRASLRCSYCHGELARGASAYCASCLAPHHSDCFREYGRCSALGCGETRLVPPEAAVEAAQPQVVSLRRAPPYWVAVATLAVAASGILLGTRFYVEKIKTSYDQKVAPVDVPVATRDLKEGDIVGKADIAIQQFPHGVVDALGGSEYLANETDEFEGGKIVVPIKQGQVFQRYHFRRSH